MTVNKPKRPERYGCLSKSLEDFLYQNEDERFEKHDYDVNKYYQRIVKNVNNSISDIMLAYTKLPEEQKNKIDLFSHIESLINFAQTEEFDKTPDKIISQTKVALYAFLQGQIDIDPDLNKLARSDFEKTIHWLNYLSPKNPSPIGAPT